MAEPHTHCQNDGTKLIADYCHTCGQRADEPRRAVIGLVQDFFVDTLAIDGKLARTIFLLLTRPGRLARRYLDGKRVRYSPPFRLYLFASVFFFITAFWMADLENLRLQPDDEALAAAEAELQAEGRPEAAEDIARLRESLSEADAPDSPDASDTPNAPGAEAADKKSIPFTEREWDKLDYSGPDWLEPHVRKLFEAGQRVVEDPRLFVAESRQNLPRTLLLAPILYALILMLLYVYRRKFYIYDHFVVSLYMHAALYSYLLLALLLGRIPVIGGVLAWAPLVWGWWQPAAVLRQAYGSNWISVVLKWAISISI
ncbi:MAG: DUF3667 domain-containing protein, partial [Hyphococcus sp.]